MKVRATRKGYIYHQMREVGEVFDLKPVKHTVKLDKDGKPLVITPAEQFSEKWMVKVDKNAKSEIQPDDKKGKGQGDGRHAEEPEDVI